MKAVILAGGIGSRLSEETSLRPKPMVEIGGKPILWHIMKVYSSFGINDFIICLGYKGSMIKEFFANYRLYSSDVTFDLSKNSVEYQPTGRFGSLSISDNGSLSSFSEKPKGDGRWVSGGFFVLSPRVGAYLKDDSTIWERNRWKRSRAKGRLRRISIPGSGRLWILCMTRRCCNHSGMGERLRGRCGNAHLLPFGRDRILRPETLRRGKVRLTLAHASTLRRRNESWRSLRLSADIGQSVRRVDEIQVLLAHPVDALSLIGEDE